MPASDYVLNLRQKIGNDLLLTPAVAFAIFDDAGRLLLGRRRDVERWIMVGGAIDPGERPADAAVREVWEETGLHVEMRTLLGVFGGPEFRITFSNGDELEPCVILFEAHVTGGRMCADGVELAELRFMTLEDTAGLPFRPATRLLVEAALTRQPAFQQAQWRPPAG